MGRKTNEERMREKTVLCPVCMQGYVKAGKVDDFIQENCEVLSKEGKEKLKKAVEALKTEECTPFKPVKRVGE